MDETEVTQRSKSVATKEGLMTEDTTLISTSTGIKTKTKRRLYTWDEIPEWQRDNEHIRSGYVSETKSLKECFCSLFYLHNESVNIYTHFLPGLCFLGVVLFDNYAIKKYDTTTWIDYAMIDFFFLGGFTCLMMSSLFHCLKCHSIEVATFGNKLDYLGIVALVVSSMVSLLYYGFHDNKPYFFTFSGLTVLFGACCTVASLKERFRSREWRAYRAALFVAFGLSALLPVIAGLIRYGFEETCARIQLKWIVLEGIFYITGAVLYGTRFPECLSPGIFDIWGNSHQIFHVLVVVAALCHLKALLRTYELVHSTGLGTHSF
ncbi:PAQR-type receptor LALA0_S08e01310g [Lachancea lanzarotensis]|uniref:LALA0S08e01310g1_1 n=1 Tax=Lachancea lanzarotensis TaxID=1245769 RepID=A0A0C7MZY6_9SACH|nr:uncharacterized protein LALA0_S08e01310g [Lachancea lanzarotensis]CEP63389.1 LALA0S08e01310g1_1 [Lachancea lanzarotensis]